MTPAYHQEKEALSPDTAARKAGLLLILTAVASIIMVFARVTANADQPTLLESLRAIADNRAMYAISAVARIASGIALIAAAWFLLKTWIIRLRLATPAVPNVLGASGAVTVLSGICALALVLSASAGADVTASGSCRDNGLSPIADGQDGLCDSRVGATYCGEVPVEGWWNPP